MGTALCVDVSVVEDCLRALTRAGLVETIVSWTGKQAYYILTEKGREYIARHRLAIRRPGA